MRLDDRGMRKAIGDFVFWGEGFGERKMGGKGEGMGGDSFSLMGGVGVFLDG